MRLEIELPLEPKPARNDRGGWRSDARRGKAEKAAVALAFKVNRELPKLRELAAKGARATVDLRRFEWAA